LRHTDASYVDVEPPEAVSDNRILLSRKTNCMRLYCFSGSYVVIACGSKGICHHCIVAFPRRRRGLRDAVRPVAALRPTLRTTIPVERSARSSILRLRQKRGWQRGWHSTLRTLTHPIRPRPERIPPAPRRKSSPEPVVVD
jgi:hypothetical protein